MAAAEVGALRREGGGCRHDLDAACGGQLPDERREFLAVLLASREEAADRERDAGDLDGAIPDADLGSTDGELRRQAERAVGRAVPEVAVGRATRAQASDGAGSEPE